MYINFSFKIPVYRGAPTALMSKGIEASHYHGNDGLGDTDLQIDVDLSLIRKEPAARALVDLVNQYPGTYLFWPLRKCSAAFK